MGTISEKLTYLNTTKQKIKQGINNLGGKITSNTTFRNYATALDTIYNKLPKVSDTGTDVSLSTTLEARLGLIPRGNALQNGTPTPSNPINIQVVTGNNTVTVSNGDNLSQSYPLNLGSLELAKIGNYEDYIEGTPNNWVKTKVIEKIDSYNGQIIATDYISTTGGLDTGATVYYVLTTSIDVPITNTTLVNQLNELYYANSYDDETNISTSCEEGNMPMRFTASVYGVANTSNLQSKSVTITENGTQNVTADSGYDGLSNVSVTTNVSGGGGGLDWSAIGYSGEPQAIIDGYNYAVEIMNNWDATSSMESKFANDRNLLFMPQVDISQVSSLTKMFQTCTFLLSVPALDYSKATYLDYMFSSCSKLKSVSNFNPTGRISYAFSGCIELETVQGNITPTMIRSTFSSCYNLKNVPIIDASNITSSNGFQTAFQNCRSLTDTSLDNILQTCISATSYSGTKTLAYMGFNATNYPTSRIEALPHYQDFINAGWTIGY